MIRSRRLDSLAGESEVLEFRIVVASQGCEWQPTSQRSFAALHGIPRNSERLRGMLSALRSGAQYDSVVDGVRRQWRLSHGRRVGGP